MNCRFCGVEMKLEDTVCPSCGKSIEEPVMTQESNVVPPVSAVGGKANVFTRYISTFKKYFVFEGRSSRSEYWTFMLLNMVIGITLSIIEGIVTQQSQSSSNTMGTLFQLAVFIPSVAVSVRRMHDVGKPGWYLIIPIYSLILSLEKSETVENKYGQNPELV